MSETFPIGKYLKAFMSNGFKYEGEILFSNDLVVRIKDNLRKEERTLVVAHIVDFVLGNIAKTKIEGSEEQDKPDSQAPTYSKRGGR